MSNPITLEVKQQSPIVLEMGFNFVAQAAGSGGGSGEANTISSPSVVAGAIDLVLPKVGVDLRLRKIASTTTALVPAAGADTINLSIADATGSVAGLMPSADFTKLSGIATGATANSIDALLRDRSTHTGTQAVGTITGLGTAATANITSFATAAQGTLAASALQAGTAISNVSGLTTALTNKQDSNTRLTSISGQANPATAKLPQLNTDGSISFIDVPSGGANFASPPAIGNITPNTAAFTSLGLTGNLSSNISSSTSSNLSLIGFSDFSAGNFCAFQFGDSFNQLANAHGKGMLLKAWHGITIHGAADSSAVAIPDGGGTTDSSLTVVGTSTSSALKVKCGLLNSAAIAIEDATATVTSIWGKSGGLNIGGSTDPGSGVVQAAVLQPNAFTTSNLPSASSLPRGIAYDSTLGILVTSNGTTWNSLGQALNARLTSISSQANPAIAKLTQLNTDGSIAFVDLPTVRQTFSNVDVTVSADTTQLAQTGTLTAPRTVTLPLANSKAPGFRIDIVGESGTSNATNKIILARSGSDLINGLTTLDAITFPNGAVYCVSDGVSRWSVFFSNDTALQNRLEMTGIPLVNTPVSVNTAATLTIPNPGASLQIVLSNIFFSYDSSAASLLNGTFTITDSLGVQAFHTFITSSGAAPIKTDMLMGLNRGCTLTLSAQSGYRGSLSCTYRTQ